MPKQSKKIRMLALASAAITTNAIAGGKSDGAPHSGGIPEPLALGQIPTPVTAMVPPFNNSDLTGSDPIAAQVVSDLNDRGIIFTDEFSQNARIDFIIGNLPPDRAFDVILAYTTNVAPFDDDNVPFGLGGTLDDDNLRSVRADGDQPPPDGQAGDGTQPPPDGQADDGTQPPPDGQAGDGTQPPPDGQAGDGTQPPPDGQAGDGTQPPPRQGIKVTHKPGQKPGLEPKDKRASAPLISPELRPRAGESCLGDTGFEVVAGISVKPNEPLFGEGTPTRIGKVAYVGQSVVISILIEQLADKFELGDELYFQAMAFPAGTFASGQYLENINQTLFSECDRFILDLPDEEAGEYPADGDLTTPDSGGKNLNWPNGTVSVLNEGEDSVSNYITKLTQKKSSTEENQ